MSWSRRLGGRNEVSSFLVLSLLLLVLVSSYTLLAYRATVLSLLEERQNEATSWARALAPRVAERGPVPRPKDLRRWMPEAYAVSIFDADGRLMTTSRSGGGLELSEPGRPLSPHTVFGTAELVRHDRRHTVQVDLWSPVLKTRAESLKVLVPLVLVVEAGVLVLLLLYARRLLLPLDRILDRAKELGTTGETQDELAFLIHAFDNALERLASPDEVELKALEKALGHSLESGVLLCDVGGKILGLNPVGADVLGIEGDPSGRSVEDVVEPYPDLAAKLQSAMAHRETVQRAECRIETPSGPKTLGLTVHPLRRDDGETRGFLILFADLTEIQRKLADERLGESLKQLGELTAGIAHEMRNGLATVKGYLTLIQRGGSRESIDDYVAEMRAETDALHRTLEDFLSFARPGHAKSESVDLVALVHRAAADPALGEGRVRTEIEVEGAARAHGDSQLLAKALANLLLNALRAQEDAEAQEPLRLCLARRNDHFSIRVLDHGNGISPHIAEKLFEPFVTGRAGGVGLGLALTRRIALLHGGSVTVENRDPGGAVAEMLLPVGKSVTESSDSAGSESAAEGEKPPKELKTS